MVIMYTDGACKGNPGPGGWATRLIHESTLSQKDLSGGSADTTNNRMELTAVIEGLKSLKKPVKISIYSDSQYIVNAFKQGWLEKWRGNGWKTSSRKPVENQDLWKSLLTSLKGHQYEFHHVKAHAGHEHNEACDRMAVAEAEKFLR